MLTPRRHSLKGLGFALAAAGLAGPAAVANDALLPVGALTLEALTKRLGDRRAARGGGASLA